MKVLTVNFLTCAVKACKASPLSFPLHFRDAELVTDDLPYNPTFLYNLLPRLEWDALRTTAEELGITTLPAQKPSPPSPANVNEAEPEGAQPEEREVERAEREAEERTWRELHGLLLETQVSEGWMVCGNCGHEYRIKEGIANFLLPNHLV